MSVEDVAHRTRIPAGIVRCLENDDYSHFPNGAYARSFLRTYSAYLEVDADDFLVEMRKTEAARPSRAARSAPRYFRSLVTPAEVEEITAVHWNLSWFPWRGILSGLFFLAVLGAGSYMVYQLWLDYRQQQPVSETSPRSRDEVASDEEGLIGGTPGEGASGGEGATTDPAEGAPNESGGDIPPGDDEVVLRAVPVDPQPVADPEPGPEDGGSAVEGASPSGDQGPRNAEGPEVGSGAISPPSGTIAVTAPPGRNAGAPTAAPGGGAPSPAANAN